MQFPMKNIQIWTGINFLKFGTQREFVNFLGFLHRKSAKLTTHGIYRYSLPWHQSDYRTDRLEGARFHAFFYFWCLVRKSVVQLGVPLSRDSSAGWTNTTKTLRENFIESIFKVKTHIKDQIQIDTKIAHFGKVFIFWRNVSQERIHWQKYLGTILSRCKISDVIIWSWHLAETSNFPPNCNCMNQGTVGYVEIKQKLEIWP